MATIKNTRAFLVKNPAQGGGVLRKLPQPINLSYTNGKNVLWYPQGAGYPVVGCYYTPQVCCVPAQQVPVYCYCSIAWGFCQGFVPCFWKKFFLYMVIYFLSVICIKFCISTAKCGCDLEKKKQRTTNCSAEKDSFTTNCGWNQL